MKVERTMWSAGLALCAASCLTVGACPSPAAGVCDPKDANCPSGYWCATIEICTRNCGTASDCWVKSENGCRESGFPGMRLPDGGTFVEGSSDYCPETLGLACIDGYCQQPRCADGSCDYDVYGPSPFKGNRTQGPTQ